MLVFVCAFAACGGNETPDGGKDLPSGGEGASMPSAGRLMKGLCEGGGCTMPPVLFFHGETGYVERFEGLYHCPPDGVKDGAIALSDGNTADEVAIFLPDGDAQKDALMKLLGVHVREEISVYESYSPADTAHLKNARLYSEKGYVVLIVSEDAERIRAALSDYLKDPGKLPPEEPSRSSADLPDDPSDGASSPDPGDLPDLPSGGSADGASSGDLPTPTPDPTPTPTPDPTPTPTPTPAPTGVYAYANDLPENGEQTEEYFADALFIGDSRMEDILHYLKPKNAGAYAYSALSVSAVFTKNLLEKADGSRCTIAEALRETRPRFTKCYLCFGLNEIGWPYLSKFSAEYEKVISLVRELNPDCTVYLMNIYPVTASHSAEQTAAGKEENNENIRRFNDCIAELAEKTHTCHLNLAAAVCDETGALPEDAAGDGVHGNIHLCRKIFAYLLTHTAR